jgi:SWI/SNF-related matrix-associated actin-dependent regulator 1 of chromatin subfamily A
MKHQVEGIKFATSRRGSLLAAEMGTGKTPMAIVSALTWLQEHPEWSRVIITVPASLRYNWQREWETWANWFPAKLTQNIKTGVVMGGGEWPDDCNIIIISYDLVHSPDYEHQIYSEPWDILLVDESHFLKGAKTKRTKAVASIKARRKILLSGSPAPNRPCELFPQLSILNPKQWGNWYHFIQRYCDAKRGYGNSWDYSGSSNTKELYERLTQGPEAIMFRILKKDCLNLKEKRHRILELPPPESCNTLLDRERMLFKMRDTTLETLKRIREGAEYGDEAMYKENAAALNSSQTAAMSEMARIRRELAVAKAPLVVEYATSILESGTNKLVIAGHHRESLAIIADALQSYGAMLYYGGVELLKRQEMVDKFQQDPSARIMVLGIMAGGVGITLTAASRIIMSESTWNTATNTQAVDRLARMGQTEQVKIDWLVFKGSLDAMVLKKCLSKDKVVDAIIDGVESKDTPQESKPQKIKTDYKALGLKMSDAQKQAALDALRHIALLDSDGAKKANGLGFNRFHSQIGRELASKVALTPAQAALAREIATKYKTQLTPSLRIALQS